ELQLELKAAQRETASLQSESQKMQERFLRDEGEKTELGRGLVASSEVSQKLQQKLLSAEDEHVHLRQELEAAKEGAHQLHVELIRVEGRRDALEGELTASKEHSQKLLATLDAAESSKTALEARLEEVEADLAAITNNAQAARQAAEKWQSQFEAADEENKDLSEKLQEREAEKMTLEAELQVLAATSQKQKLEIATAEEEKTDVERQLEKSRQEASEAAQTLKEAGETWELELSAATEGTQKLLAMLDAAESSKRTLEARLAEVEADLLETKAGPHLEPSEAVAEVQLVRAEVRAAVAQLEQQFVGAEDDSSQMLEDDLYASKVASDLELSAAKETLQLQQAQLVAATEKQAELEQQLVRAEGDISQMSEDEFIAAKVAWNLELSAAKETMQLQQAQLVVATEKQAELEQQLARARAEATLMSYEALHTSKVDSDLELSAAKETLHLQQAQLVVATEKQAELEQQLARARAEATLMSYEALHTSKVDSDLELSAAKETLHLQQAQLVVATEKQAELEQQLARAEATLMSYDALHTSKVDSDLELSAAKETLHLQQAQLVVATEKQAELEQQLARARAEATLMSYDALHTSKVDSDLELSAAKETLQLQQAQLVAATEKQAELEQQLVRAEADSSQILEGELAAAKAAWNLELSAAKETLQLQQAQLVAATEKQAELEQQLAGARAEAALRPEDTFSAYSGRAEARETEFVAAKVAGNLELSAAKETSQLQPAQLVAATDKQAELAQHLARTEADSSQMSDSLHSPASRVDSDLELSAAKETLQRQQVELTSAAEEIADLRRQLQEQKQQQQQEQQQQQQQQQQQGEEVKAKEGVQQSELSATTAISADQVDMRRQLEQAKEAAEVLESLLAEVRADNARLQARFQGFPVAGQELNSLRTELAEAASEKASLQRELEHALEEVAFAHSCLEAGSKKEAAAAIELEHALEEAAFAHSCLEAASMKEAAAAIELEHALEEAAFAHSCLEAASRKEAAAAAAAERGLASPVRTPHAGTSATSSSSQEIQAVGSRSGDVPRGGAKIWARLKTQLKTASPGS
ncbi:unnamed protein product, partial [Polarella glacialis]